MSSAEASGLERVCWRRMCKRRSVAEDGEEMLDTVADEERRDASVESLRSWRPSIALTIKRTANTSRSALSFRSTTTCRRIHEDDARTGPANNFRARYKRYLCGREIQFIIWRVLAS